MATTVKTLLAKIGRRALELDIKHFFHTSLAQCLFFKAYSNVKNPRFGSSLRTSEILEGLKSRKEEMTATKARSNFIQEKHQRPG